MSKDFQKKLADKLFAIFIFLIFIPVIIIIIPLVWIEHKGKLFFVQQRIGYKARPFYIFKFKTMNDLKDEKGNLLPDMQRMSFIGRLLRKTSLDELPQLWNILKGEMSFVGPRPLLWEYLPLLDETQALRHLVKPGITGWAQVNGRNKISWEKKFELDVWYVHHRSFWLDLKILWLTLKQWRKTGEVNSQTGQTMPKFERKMNQ